MVMVSVRGIIVTGSRDVGLVALKEGKSGAFSAYICWLNGGF